MIVTAAMDEVSRSGRCREQGLYPTELEAWERELNRKDKTCSCEGRGNRI